MFPVYESRLKVSGGFFWSGLFLRGEAVPANMLAFYFSSPLQGLLCLLNSCLQCSLYMKAVRKFWAAFWEAGCFWEGRLFLRNMLVFYFLKWKIEKEWAVSVMAFQWNSITIRNIQYIMWIGRLYFTTKLKKKLPEVDSFGCVIENDWCCFPWNSKGITGKCLSRGSRQGEN